MEDQIKLSKAKGEKYNTTDEKQQVEQKTNKKPTESFKAKVVEVEFISTPPTF